MNDERDRRLTERRNARSNTTAPASGTPGDDAGPSEEGGTTLQYRRGSSRTDSASDEESTSAGFVSGDRDGALLPPSVYREGRTVTASAPSRDGIEDYLHEVYRNTPPVDGVIVLTTERSATELLESLLTEADGKRASIGIIDTRSAGQYVEDVYRESPVHYTTADGDEALEQWVDGAVRIERDAEAGIETRYERP